MYVRNSDQRAEAGDGGGLQGMFSYFEIMEPLSMYRLGVVTENN
jgi:hypothetical protein